MDGDGKNIESDLALICELQMNKVIPQKGNEPMHTKHTHRSGEVTGVSLV